MVSAEVATQQERKYNLEVDVCYSMAVSIDLEDHDLKIICLVPGQR